MTATIVRAEPGTVGTAFIQPTEDHECHAACYRVSADDKYIYTMCDVGHSVSMCETSGRSSFGGSAFAASLNDLPAYAPFVIVK